MASSNAVRFLANAGGTDDLSLGLKMFWGSVVEAFRNSSLLWDNTVPVIARKTMTSGKSWQFLMLADTPEPEDHVPGNELLGQQYEIEEGTITVDSPLAVHHDVPFDQLLIAHFDILGPLGQKMGKRLARKYDQRLFITGCLAARAAAATKNGLTVHSGGNRVTKSGGTVAAAYPTTQAGAAAFRDDLATLAKNMDEDNVPEDDRYLFITPYMRQVLTKDSSGLTPFTGPSQLFSRDFQNGNNNINKRIIAEIEGFKLVGITNHLPSTNVTDGPTKYQGNFTAQASNGIPVALALCGAANAEAAIGMVSLQGIIPQMEPDARRSTMFMKAEMLVGAGVLHPWCGGSVEVTT